MLKIKNNDIYLNRGETAAINIKAWNKNGSPLILPPLPRFLPNIATKFTVDTTETWTFHSPFRVNSVELPAITVNAKSGTPCIIQGIDGDGNAVTQHIAVNTYTLLITSMVYVLSIIATDVTSIKINGDDYSTDTDLMSVLAFTVRAGNNDAIVLQKYLNLHTNLVYEGEIDDIANGWNRFTTQNYISGAADVLLERLSSQMADGIYTVGRLTNGDYVHAMLSDSLKLVPYEFDISIPILHEDTQFMEEKEYTYDIIIYQGYIKDLSVYEKNEFPFREITWKKEIVEPHKFVIGGSHNA